MNLLLKFGIALLFSIAFYLFYVTFPAWAYDHGFNAKGVASCVIIIAIALLYIFYTAVIEDTY